MSSNQSNLRVERLSRTTSLLLLVLIGVAVAIPSLPGRISADPLDMYLQALTGRYHDWHPPIVPWIWSRLGPTPLVIATQTVGFVVMVVLSAAKLIRSAGASRLQTVVFVSFFIALPPVHGFLVAVSKDTWAAALMLVLMALSVAEQRARFSYQAFRAILFAAAAYLRPELILFFPLFILNELLVRKNVAKWLAGAGFAFIAATTLMTATAVEDVFVKPERRSPAQQLFVFDLAGLSVNSGEMLLPPSSFPPHDLVLLRKHYWPVSIGPLAFGEPKEEKVRFVSPEQARHLRTIWMQSILRFPSIYLNQKWQMTKEYVVGHWPYHPGIDPNPYLSLYFPALHAQVDAVLGNVPSFFYSRYSAVFGSLALAVLLAVGRWENRYVFVTFLAFAALYQLSFIFLATEPGFRYGYAGVLIFYASCAALLARMIAVVPYSIRLHDRIQGVPEGIVFKTAGTATSSST